MKFLKILHPVSDTKDKPAAAAIVPSANSRVRRTDAKSANSSRELCKDVRNFDRISATKDRSCLHVTVLRQRRAQQLFPSGGL